MSDAVLNFSSMEIVFLSIDMVENLKGLIKSYLTFRYTNCPRM